MTCVGHPPPWEEVRSPIPPPWEGDRGGGRREGKYAVRPLASPLRGSTCVAGDRVSKTPQPRLTPRQLPYEGRQGALGSCPVVFCPPPYPPPMEGGMRSAFNEGDMRSVLQWRGCSFVLQWRDTRNKLHRYPATRHFERSEKSQVELRLRRCFDYAQHDVIRTRFLGYASE